MLDPWIIEEIIKQEKVDQQGEQPLLEIPIIRDLEQEDHGVLEEDEVERGVVIVDFRV